ncbi:MAG: peptidoglycan editing factor PgeF [Alphaproteobacteria bacterium]|nr:peptidoglycan editing factor PgeF [Alphaproteobacteria bacterium]
MLLTSRLLAEVSGVAHGFTTRGGGVSAGPLASLNLAMRPGEQPEALSENWRRVGAALGMPGAKVALVSQVHGDVVREGDDARGPLEALGEADAVVVTRPGVLAAVRVADCVPVLIAGPGVVAAVHAGWRGTAAAIVQRAVEVMCARGGLTPGQLRAAIGPHIGSCCYEVGEEVVEALRPLAPEAVVVARRAPKPYVDLGAVNEALLRAAGVEQVERLEACTRCRSDLFSHRGDGPSTGRSAGVIGLTPCS